MVLLDRGNFKNMNTRLNNIRHFQSGRHHSRISKFGGFDIADRPRSVPALTLTQVLKKIFN